MWSRPRSAACSPRRWAWSSVMRWWPPSRTSWMWAIPPAMEERLDQIAEGELGYADMLSDFYAGFARRWRARAAAMPQAIEQRAVGGRLGRAAPAHLPPVRAPLAGASQRGRALSGLHRLPRVPLHSRPASGGQPPGAAVDEFAEGEICELCGGRMKVITRGRNKFLGCENYPRCKNTRPS